MSTKTLRKRIALATVAALGAGVLSLVSTSAAHASAAGDTTATTGSVGLLASSSNINTASATTKTATLLSTGSLVLTSVSTGYYEVSAGAAITAAAGGTIGSSQSSFTAASGDTFTIKPTGAVGSTFTVSGYASSAKASLVSQLVVTIAGTSVAGTVSPADSYVSWVSSSTTGSAATADASGASSATAGNKLYLQIDLNDAYGAAVTAAGALVVTASKGAVVGIGNSTGSVGGASVGNYSTAVYSSALTQGSNGTYVAVGEATAGTGWAGTVTVTYNGVTVATKSGTISGYASKIVLSNNQVSQTGTTTTDAIRYNVYDAAGNGVVVTAAQLVKNATSNSAVVSDLVGATNENITSGSIAKGKITVTGGSAGKADVSVKYTRPDGATVVSNTISHLVGGNASTYSVKFDKSTYAPGDIATVTVSFKDSTGAVANSTGAVTTITSSKTDSVIATPQLTIVGAYSTSTAETPDANGEVVYTYTVGSTDGAYAASFSYPTLTNGTAQTASYKVASGSTSLNDVLKGIVALIASINKQIAALAKLVTKKK